MIEIDEDDAEDIREGHVDAACVCCELVARMRPTGAADDALQTVLDAVLCAITGKQQDPDRIQQLFTERFKSAGGGQLLIEGRGKQLMIEGAAPAPGVPSKIRRVTLTSTEAPKDKGCADGSDDGENVHDTRIEPPHLQGVFPPEKSGPRAQENQEVMSTPPPAKQPATSLAGTQVPPPSSCTQTPGPPLRCLPV